MDLWRCVPSHPPPHPHTRTHPLTRPTRALAGIGKVGSTYVALQGLRYLDTTTFVWHDPTAQINGVEHAPSARYGAAAVVLGSRLLLAGGMASALPHAPNHANHSVGGHPPPGVAAVGAVGAGGEGGPEAQGAAHRGVEQKVDGWARLLPT